MNNERGERPWGYYLVLIEGQGYKVKQFVVRPGKRLSLQKHFKRREHWQVVRGKALVTVGSDPGKLADASLVPGEYIDIPLEAYHRVESVGTEDLVIIEVQMGDYLGEDDILRVEDDFGRAEAPV
ncbi:MAG: phosphomannose isomerase type II C-terminal cupin domain [Syntrophorhabdaceae bacterium]|nr:phosphomannose isomerase type II C-terminal cupin domain [Syntrophorhabdaceae bacterium]